MSVNLFLYTKKALKYLLRFFLGFISLLLLYLFFAILLTLIPSNSSVSEADEGITIYLKSNGFHIDLVLPTQTPAYDWQGFIDLDQFSPPPPTPPPYLAFGWGDKGFFYDVPHIEDLTVGVAANALFLPSSSVMHVIVYNYPPTGKHFTPIQLSTQQYQQLVAHVKSGFSLNRSQLPIRLAGTGYGSQTDLFYKGEGSYSLLNTCNNWANTGLKKAGIKTATWAPFAANVLYHFNKR